MAAAATTAMVMMTILGCDDSGVECVPLNVSEEQWESIAACDAKTEAVLETYTSADVNYPMVVAVCETAYDAASANTLFSEEPQASEIEEFPEAPLPDEGEASGPKGVLSEILTSIAEKTKPITRGISDAVTAPVHVVTDTYSWVARKITD